MFDRTTGEDVSGRKSSRSKKIIAVPWRGVFYIKQESNTINW